jgi:uncharacterized protein (DUF305 family)
MRASLVVAVTVGLASLPLAACAPRVGPGSAAQTAPIVQPGAPGQSTRAITAEQAVSLPRVQRMIAHHTQALEMTALRAPRSTNESVRLMALRIELSQSDEIRMMQDWLKARGEALPDAHAHHSDQAAPMPGMLTTEEMSRLSEARGSWFDRLFLELMIKHHEGALVMVEELFASPGAGQESDVFAFASDVVDDQRIEIQRMAVVLKELPQ